MSKRPWMPLYVADYLADTFDLRADESGVYLTMLMLAWRRPDAGLPNDMEWLKRSLKSCLSDMHGHQFNRIVPKLLERFFTLEDGVWTNKRLTNERQKADKWSANASENANKRWSKAKENKDIPDAKAMLTHSQSHSESQSNPPGGAQAPAAEFRTPSKVLFDEGVKFLGRHGQSDRNARTLIGKWRKNIGDPMLLEVLSQAMRDEVSDAIPWIEQAVKARQNGNGGSTARNGTGARRVSAGDAYIAGVAELGRELGFADRGCGQDDLAPAGKLPLEPIRNR